MVTFQRSCDAVSEAASQTDLSGSGSMDLVGTLSDLVVDETITEGSYNWKTAEGTGLHDDTGDAVAGAVASLGDQGEGAEATQAENEESTDDPRDSRYRHRHRLLKAKKWKTKLRKAIN
ncbi:hypothetical protein M378DRAFT_9491 [Amanita muscaria Koide BX008]|uniref:Uncharacterized protein n=1 Tax=Amanita muscaria (strain Koide BX008) TaxID=946122 RepID=A0A0C2XEI8_AMAMK|nr:hypothetical protein M378DRAFT_9491 [Amanita muscaria Koide BX008]